MSYPNRGRGRGGRFLRPPRPPFPDEFNQPYHHSLDPQHLPAPQYGQQRGDRPMGPQRFRPPYNDGHNAQHPPNFRPMGPPGFRPHCADGPNFRPPQNFRGPRPNIRHRPEYRPRHYNGTSYDQHPTGFPDQQNVRSSTNPRRHQKELPYKFEVLKYLKAKNVKYFLGEKYKVMIVFHDVNGCLRIDGEDLANVEKAADEIKTIVECSIVDSTKLTSDQQKQLKMVETTKQYHEIVTELKKLHLVAGWHVRDDQLYVCTDKEDYVSAASSTILCTLSKLPTNESTKNTDSSHLSLELPFSKEYLCKPETIRFLKAKGLNNSLNEEHKVEVTFYATKQFMRIQGKQKNVEQAVCDIERTIGSLTIQIVNLSPPDLRRFESIPYRDIVIEMKKMKIVVGWELQNGQLDICSDSSESVETAIRSVMTLISSRDAGGSLPPLCMQPNLQHLEKLAFKHEQIRYIKSVQMISKLEKKFQIVVTVETLSVNLAGEKGSVMEAKAELQQFIDIQSTDSFKKSKEFCSCLEKLPNRTVINSLRSAQVRTGWALRDNQLWVCSDSKASIKKAESVLSSMVVEFTYPDTPGSLCAKQLAAVKTDPNWTELLRQISEQNVMLQLDENSSMIKLAISASENKNLVIHKLQNFFAPLNQQTKEITLPSSDIESLFQKNKDAIEKRCQLQGNESVIVCIEDQSIELSSCSEKSMCHASQEIHSLLKGIRKAKVSAEKRGSVAWLLSSGGKDKLKDISLLRRTTTALEEFQDFQKISLPHTDRTNVNKMELVVEDISQILSKFDGVLTNDGAVSRTVAMLANGAALTNGNQALTLPGSSHVVYVYHIAVSSWSSKHSIQELKTNVCRALASFSSQPGLRSILLPAIGTGGLGFPADDVAEMMLTTTLEHLNTNPQTSIERVTFVTNKQDHVYQAFKGKLDQIQANLPPYRTDSSPVDSTPVNKIVVTFTGLTLADIEKSTSKLESEMKDQLVTEMWTNSPRKSAISKLSVQQIAKLNQDGVEKNVDITIDLSAPDITIEGLKADTQCLRDEIDTLLDNLTESTSSKVPANWDKDAMRLRTLKVKLDPTKNQEEFKKVSDHFLKTCQSSAQISEIFRIQNEELYMQYQAQKSRVKREVGSSFKEEEWLWHGTDSVDLICANEFNRSFCGRNGVAYGQGVYFSTTSQYSLSYTSSNSMILAKVVTGRYKLGNSSTTRQNLPQSYHSTVNSESSPSIFVVYHDAAAYPEYVIRFSR